MKKLTGGLVLGVFCAGCLLAWSMLTLMFDVQNGGRVIPYFTNLCILLRPVLLALPVVAAASYGWLCFRRECGISQWTGFVLATMMVLIAIVLPVISTSYLLMTDQVKVAVGIH